MCDWIVRGRPCRRDAIRCAAHAQDPTPKFTPAPADHQPPSFLPAIALYTVDGHFVALEVGKTFSFSCKEALADTQTTLAKATTLSSHKAVGLCIPIPTYNAADLIPSKEPPKAPADNQV
jgi:hypothetical protein